MKDLTIKKLYEPASLGIVRLVRYNKIDSKTFLKTVFY